MDLLIYLRHPRYYGNTFIFLRGTQISAKFLCCYDSILNWSSISTHTVNSIIILTHIMELYFSSQSIIDRLSFMILKANIFSLIPNCPRNKDNLFHRTTKILVNKFLLFKTCSILVNKFLHFKTCSINLRIWRLLLTRVGQQEEILCRTWFVKTKAINKWLIFSFELPQNEKSPLLSMPIFLGYS